MILNFVIAPFKSLLNDRSIPFDVLFFSILLFSIPIVLITGPAIPDIFLSLIALYFLVKSILKKKWEYYQNPIFYGFILFSLYGIIRSIFSDLPFESLTNGGSVFYFRYIFFAIGVWYLLDHNKYLSKCLLNISILCITIVCVDSIYQYFFEINLFGNKKFIDSRLTSLFGDEPIVGRYISYLSIFVFTLIYQNYSNHKNMIKLLVIFLILCQVVVFLSGERSPFFYFILFSIFIFIFSPNIRIYIVTSAILSLIVISIITFFNPNAKTRIIDLTIKQVNQTQIPFLPYSDHHEEHYISSLKMFNDKPVFGIGTNLFRYHCQKPIYIHKTRSCSTHPHNYYFQSLAELGIVGFLFISIFFLYFLIICLKQLSFLRKYNDNKSIPFEILIYPIILSIYWWPLIPHMNFYNNWNNVLIMLPLGFFMKYFFGKTS